MQDSKQLLQRISEIDSEHSLREQERESGEFKSHESCFEAPGIRSKRKLSRGATRKTSVFRFLKRNEKVFVTIVIDCSQEELISIISGKILEESTILPARRKADVI